MYSQAPEAGIASLLASRGRGEDTMLVHMTPGEVQALQGIANAAGGSLSLNPNTGLPEAGFLKELLPTIAGSLLKSVFPGMGELGIGLIGAGISGLIEGDLKKGLMAGMGAYSGAKTVSGLTQLGQENLARKKFEQEGVKLNREKLAEELGLATVRPIEGGPRSNLIRQAMNLPTTPTVEMPDLDKLREAYVQREIESMAGQRPSMDVLKSGIGSLFKPKGFERFQSAVGGPKQLGFVVSPILGAAQRAEKENARKKFARSRTPDYYYTPGAFDFESGTFAPGQYYTAPGQPYTPKFGFADGGVVFQEGGETGTEGLKQYYQGLLTPPDTSLGEARRTETLDYINWLNQFLKQRPPADAGIAPPGSGGNVIAGDGTTGGATGPSAGTTVATGRTSAPEAEQAATEPDFDRIDVVRESPIVDTYVPPAQVPIDDIYVPPQPIITLPEEEEDTEYGVGIEAAPEAGFEGVNPFAEDYTPVPVEPTKIEEGEGEVTVKDFSELTPAEKRELGDMPPSDLGQSILDRYRDQPVQLSDMVFTEPSREQVVDYLTQQGPPDIAGTGLLSRVWDSTKHLPDAALKQIESTGGVTGAALGLSRELWKQVQEGKLSLEDAFKAAGKGAIPDELEKLIEKEKAAEEPTTEEAAAGAGGGGGDGEYFSTFGRDPYSNLFRDIVYGDGGTGSITTEEIVDKAPDSKAAGGIISNYNRDLNLANLDPRNFMNPQPVTIPPMSRGLGTEDLRMMARTGAAGSDYNFGFAQGGLTGLPEYQAGGKLLRGPGDGMSDDIKANIDGQQEARLADGEFVVPADVVSHLGNGSTEAGAKKLYAMMDRIRKARTGSTKQGREINPNKFLPA